MEYKLYKWYKNVLPNWRSGLALAVATDENEARRLIRAEFFKRRITPLLEEAFEKNIDITKDYQQYSKEAILVESIEDRKLELEGLIKAISVEPEKIIELPCAEFTYGSE